MRILLLNGPNLGRLGKRQPEIYGSTTLAQVEEAAAEHAAGLGHTLTALQSNHDGVIIDRIEERDYDAIIIGSGFGDLYARHHLRGELRRDRQNAAGEALTMQQHPPRAAPARTRSLGSRRTPRR